MQDGCKVYMDSYMASDGSCFMVTWTIRGGGLEKPAEMQPSEAATSPQRVGLGLGLVVFSILATHPAFWLLPSLLHFCGLEEFCFLEESSPLLQQPQFFQKLHGVGPLMACSH